MYVVLSWMGTVPGASRSTTQQGYQQGREKPSGRTTHPAKRETKPPVPRREAYDDVDEVPKNLTSVQEVRHKRRGVTVEESGDSLVAAV